MDTSKYILITDGSITASEVTRLRDRGEPVELWRQCLEQALYVVGAREKSTGKLVGIGFLVGNARHAEFCDLTVHPDFRRQGIGGAVFDERVRYVRQHDITFVMLTIDTTKPWLQDFYGRHGFVGIDFAMMLEDSFVHLPGHQISR